MGYCRIFARTSNLCRWDKIIIVQIWKQENLLLGALIDAKQPETIKTKKMVVVRLLET